MCLRGRENRKMYEMIRESKNLIIRLTLVCRWQVCQNQGPQSLPPLVPEEKNSLLIFMTNLTDLHKLEKGRDVP